MTDTEFQSWLSSPTAIKCILVEVGVNIGGTEQVVYLSNRGYTTFPSDTPANTVYKPIIKSGLSLSQALSLDSKASISWGDIEITNPSGDFDEYLTYIWSNRVCNVYLGDVSWIRSDFRLVFTGKVEDVGSRSRDTINLKIRDNLNKLNSVITEVNLGGTTSNKDKLLPLCFGEVHNIEPLLVDPTNLEYQVHQGSIERIIEVRDNGVPVTVTESLSTGKFRLTSSPVGTITCSIQGAKPSGTYTNNIATLIKYIVKTYGKEVLLDSDIDLTNFSAFESTYTQPVGLYVDSKANVLDIINKLADSIGAQVTMNTDGKLQLQRIDIPYVGSTVVTVSQSSITEKSFSIVDKLKVKAAVNIGYCKNYTVQNALTTGLLPEHIALFAKEWLEAKTSDSSVASLYAINTEADIEETCLLNLTTASTESTRRLNIYKSPRFTYEFETTMEYIGIKLGDYITVQHPRFGFSTGKKCQVIGVSIDWFRNRIKYKVIV